MTSLRFRPTLGAAVALLAGLAGCSGTPPTSAGAIPPQVGTSSGVVQPAIKMVRIPHAPPGAGKIASDGAGGEWFAECASTIARVDEKTHKFSQYKSSFAKTSCGGGVALGRNGAGMWFTDPTDNKLGFIWLKSHKFNVYRIPTSQSGPTSITAGHDNAMWFTEAAPYTKRGRIGRVDLSVHPYKVSEYTLPYNGGKGQPYEIALGPDGALWFTDPYAQGIGRITTDGQISFYRDDNIPISITAASDGGLWYTDSTPSSLSRIDPYTHHISRTPFGYDTLYEITTRGSELWITGAYSSFRYGYYALVLSVNVRRHNEAKAYQIAGTPQLDGITPGSDCRVWFTEPGANSIGNLLPPGPC